MQHLSTYFVAALKAEVEQGPRGTRAKIARNANMSRGQISDILYGRQKGTEETRRSLAQALGWDYEEFLNYGQCLTENREYQRRPTQALAYDPRVYKSIPLFKRVKQVGSPKGKIVVPDEASIEPPLLLNKQFLGGYESDGLVAFSLNSESWEATSPLNSVVVVDTTNQEQSNGQMFLTALAPSSDKYIARRLRSNGPELYLMPENPDGIPTLLKHDWQRVVIGRIIWVWKPMG